MPAWEKQKVAVDAVTATHCDLHAAVNDPQFSVDVLVLETKHAH